MVTYAIKNVVFVFSQLMFTYIWLLVYFLLDIPRIHNDENLAIVEVNGFCNNNLILIIYS